MYHPPLLSRREGSGILVLILALLFCVPSSQAQEHSLTVLGSVDYDQVHENWHDCGLRKLSIDAFVSRRPSPSKQEKAAANIQVNYGSGFSSEARAAFERAVAIWETHVASPTPIRIQATFEDLDERTLGGAGPTRIYGVDTNGDDDADTIFGDALVDALTGEDQGDGRPDIQARFNRSRDDWHFGEGDAPAGTIDFTTVVLHEIAHGLNYISFFQYQDGEGSYGVDFDGNDQVDADEEYAGVYGQHLVQEQSDERFVFLTNQQEFPTPSTALGDAMTSSRVFFDGDKAEQGAQESSGPVPPKIYAPPEYTEGSSLSHLDEGTYPFETVNALMTPNIAQAETNWLPGPIVCGQFIDMGWPIGPGCAFEEVEIVATNAVRGQISASNRGTVELNWTLEGGGAGRVDSFQIDQQRFVDPASPENSNVPYTPRKTVPASGPGSYSTTIENVRVGTHRFRVSYVTPGGTTVPAGDPVTVRISAQQTEITVYPNPFTDVAKVSFVLTETQDVRVDVYDALGRRVATPFEGQRRADHGRPVVFNAGRIQDLGSGIYFFRVTGETFSETVKAVRIR